MKKDKNPAGQISIYSIFDEIANPKHLAKYKSTPNQLADEIQDLKTLLQFASTNYTQKARKVLNLSKQFNKSIQSTAYAINQLEFHLNKIPRYSYPQLAYQTLKKTTKIQLQQQQNQQLDWRVVLTQYQLKFLQSKNMAHINWMDCYNNDQRCLEISKIQLLKQQNKSNDKSILIQLGLKIEDDLIVWNVKKILYHKNAHPELLKYYQTELMPFIRQQHTSLQQSQKYVLIMLFKSIDFVDLMLLYIQLKNMPFNVNKQKDNQQQNINNQNSLNPILDLFDENQINKSKYLKNKNVKVCFLLDCSTFKPAVILRVEGLNFLKFQFNTQTNSISIKIKLRANLQQKTLKKFIGQIKMFKITMSLFLQIVNEVIHCMEIYENLINQKAEEWKLNLFIQNRTTFLFLFLRSISLVVIEEPAVKNQNIISSIKYNRSISHVNYSGMHIIYQSLTSFRSYLPIVTSITYQQSLILKTSTTQPGFLNKIFKYHISITFQQAMHHICYLQQIQRCQSQQNWLVKLALMDIYKKDQFIYYAFKHQLTTDKKPLRSTILPQSPLLNSKLFHGPSSKLQQNHNSISPLGKDINVTIRISQNFKCINYICVVMVPNQHAIQNNSQLNQNINKLSEVQIPQKYFGENWRKYNRQRNQSEFLRNQFLNMEQLVRSAHYILNHFQFSRYIKGKAEVIFKNQQMIQLMDQ